MPQIRPFQFTHLPRYTREQVAVHESLATYLSYEPFSEGFAKGLGEVLESYLKVKCRFSDPELHTGLVLYGLAPCIAMVIIFTFLAKGNAPMALVFVGSFYLAMRSQMRSTEVAVPDLAGEGPGHGQGPPVPAGRGGWRPLGGGPRGPLPRRLR